MVRKPLSVAARSRRAPEEHLAAHLPRLFRLLMRWVTRLPPESRLRQAMIWRAMRQAFASTNRKDFAAVLPRYAPDVLIRPARELAGVGMSRSYRGRDGYLRLWGDWDSAWTGHAQWEPRELIDLGDRLVTLCRMRGTGGASGIAFDIEVALVMTLEDGRVIREEHYGDPAEALEVVGLEPSAREG
jgi:ketosteroid isomerase-like protein